MLKKLAVLIVLLTTSCNLIFPKNQKAVSDNKAIHSSNSVKKELRLEVTLNCNNLTRLLNPASAPPSLKSDLDRFFYLAYDHETKGDFDEAILNYRKASKLSNCECDRLHAEAGVKAAIEAKKLFEEKGTSAKPTQFFWGRLQSLTQGLPCLKVKK